MLIPFVAILTVYSNSVSWLVDRGIKEIIKTLLYKLIDNFLL